MVLKKFLKSFTIMVLKGFYNDGTEKGSTMMLLTQL